MGTYSNVQSLLPRGDAITTGGLCQVGGPGVRETPSKVLLAEGWNIPSNQSLSTGLGISKH